MNLAVINLIFAELISKLSATKAQALPAAQPVAIPCPIDRPLQTPDRALW